MDAGDENKPEVLLVFQVLLVFLFHLGDGRHAFLRQTPQSTIVSIGVELCFFRGGGGAQAQKKTID